MQQYIQLGQLPGTEIGTGDLSLCLKRAKVIGIVDDYVRSLLLSEISISLSPFLSACLTVVVLGGHLGFELWA